MLLNQPKAVHWESDFAVTKLVLIDIGVASVVLFHQNIYIYIFLLHPPIGNEYVFLTLMGRYGQQL